MANAIDISSLASELQDYIHENSTAILTDVMYGLDSTEHCTVIETKGKTPLVDMQTDGLVKPSVRDGSFDETDGDLAFAARYLEPEFGKVDLTLVPQSMWGTYMARQRKAGSSDSYSLSFEEWIMQEWLPQRIKFEIESRSLWRGVRNDSGSSASALMNGFLKIVTDEISASNLTPVTTGTITSSNAVAKIELLYDALSDELKGVPTKMFMSPTIYNWYCRIYRSSNGALNWNDGFKKIYIDGTQCELVPRPGMATSQRLIITPQDNIFIGFDLESDIANVTAQQHLRKIYVMMDFAVDAQFGMLSKMKVNDQA